MIGDYSIAKTFSFQITTELESNLTSTNNTHAHEL